MSGLRGLDREAVRRGATVAIAVALPAGVAAQVLAGGDDPPTAAIRGLYLLVVLGLGAGGWVAGRRQLALAQSHGAAAALVAFAVIQALGLVRRLVVGEGVNLTGIVFSALLASSCGLLGGWLGARHTLRRRASGRSGRAHAD